MSREVLSNREYQYLDSGYLVDNLPWQDEIRKRLEVEASRRAAENRPAEGLAELEPAFLTESVEEPPVPVPTAEEVLEKAREEAAEKSKLIEQAARKNAFEIVEQARWEATDLQAKAKEEAEKEAAQIKENAVESGKKEGLEKGRLEGLEKGRLEGLKEYSTQIQKWDGLFQEAVVERKRLLGEMRPLLVELVGEALHRCLKQEADRSPMVVGFVEEALKKAQDRVHLKVRLNPEDAKEVEAKREELQLSVGAGALELVPDARIERGGCLLETEAGSVDARLATVVEQVKDSLRVGAFGRLREAGGYESVIERCSSPVGRFEKKFEPSGSGPGEWSGGTNRGFGDRVLGAIGFGGGSLLDHRGGRKGPACVGGGGGVSAEPGIVDAAGRDARHWVPAAKW